MFKIRTIIITTLFSRLYVSFSIVLTCRKHLHDRTSLLIGVSWAHITCLRRDWRYQKGNQNPYIEEQTTQWQKKVQKDKLRYTKHTHITKDRVTRTPLKTGVNSGSPEGWAVHSPLVPNTVGTVPKSNWQIVERCKIGTSKPLTNIYMTVHFPGLVQAHQ
jgi:hypothetical protein